MFTPTSKDGPMSMPGYGIEKTAWFWEQYASQTYRYDDDDCQ